MADDHDELIATLTAEGWEPANAPAWAWALQRNGARAGGRENGYAQVDTNTWASSFVGATPNAVMLRLWRKVPAMLTDEQADRCAVALGLHPSQVWPGWDEAGLSVLDAMFLRSGWRRAWEFEQSESVAVPA